MRFLVLAVGFILLSSKVFSAEDATINWSVSPIIVGTGLINSQLEFKFSDHVMVGPTLTKMILDEEESRFESKGFGLVASYYAKPLFEDGLYFGASLATTELKLTPKKAYLNYSADSIKAVTNAVRFGYHWFGDGINMKIGMTLENPQRVTYQGSNGLAKAIGSHVYNGIEWQLGFHF